MKNGLPSVSSLIACTSAGFTSCSAIVVSSAPTSAAPSPLSAMRSYSTSRRSARQRVGERVLAVQLDVAVRAEHEQPLLRREARDVAQHRDGAAVRPVQVVEHEHDRRARRQRDQELRDGIEQAEALLVRLQRRRLRRCPAAARAAPAPAARSAARRSRGLRAAASGSASRGVVRDRLGERPVRRRPLALEAAAPAAPSRRRARAARANSSHVRVLPMPGSPTSITSPPRPARASSSFCCSRAISVGAPDERRVRERTPPGSSRSYTTSHAATGAAMPFSSSAPRSRNANAWRPASRPATSALQRICPASARSQSRRAIDDRRAEVVGLVAQRLADVQADADRRAARRRAPPRRLLHRDGAAHGVGGGGERDHQAVAEPLHLVPAVRARRRRAAAGGAP